MNIEPFEFTVGQKVVIESAIGKRQVGEVSEVFDNNNVMVGNDVFNEYGDRVPSGKSIIYPATDEMIEEINAEIKRVSALRIMNQMKLADVTDDIADFIISNYSK